jgi:predicted nucleic acid-binding protein
MHRQPDHLFEDALIAATAIVHHLAVVKRNLRHFTAFQVDTLDPFATK